MGLAPLATNYRSLTASMSLELVKLWVLLNFFFKSMLIKFYTHSTYRIICTYLPFHNVSSAFCFTKFRHENRINQGICSCRWFMASAMGYTIKTLGKWKMRTLVFKLE